MDTNKENYINCAPRDGNGYIDGNRGSGRTTLMMNRVREFASKGYHCVVVLATESQIKNLRSPPIEEYSSGGSIRYVSFHDLERRLRGFSSNTVVFYDHYTTDRDLIETKRNNYFLKETNKRLNEQLDAAEQKMADLEYQLNQARKTISITQQCRDMGLLDQNDNVSVDHLMLKMDYLRARNDAYAEILDEINPTEKQYRKFLDLVKENEARETSTRRYIESLYK
jgi:hypothetical protein